MNLMCIKRVIKYTMYTDLLAVVKHTLLHIHTCLYLTSGGDILPDSGGFDIVSSYLYSLCRTHGRTKTAKTH